MKHGSVELLREGFIDWFLLQRGTCFNCPIGESEYQTVRSRVISEAIRDAASFHGYLCDKNEDQPCVYWPTMELALKFLQKNRSTMSGDLVRG